jgi:transposase-like protein
MSLNSDARQEKGYTIAQTHGYVKRVDPFNYAVKSQSGNGEYEILSTEFGGYVCSCPDHTIRNVKCKHIYAVEFSLQFRKVVEVRKIEPITDVSNCIYCKSERIAKDGIRHNKSGDIQIFNCKACGRYFTINIGFEKMKHDPKGITTAIQLYFSGESLRNTAESLRLLGMDVSHQTIYNWIEKYTGLMSKYLEQITPSVSSTWRTDELFLKVKGNTKYLYALMDDETRFWIAQQVADSKYTEDVRPLFKEADK